MVPAREPADDSLSARLRQPPYSRAALTLDPIGGFMVYPRRGGHCPAPGEMGV
jgi:hypothetical protein